jgi:hypothetical protein
VNSKLTAYYTNPLISLSNLAVSKSTWQNSDAQTLPYGRGLEHKTKVSTSYFTTIVEILNSHSCEFCQKRSGCCYSKFGFVFLGASPSRPSRLNITYNLDTCDCANLPSILFSKHGPMRNMYLQKSPIHHSDIPTSKARWFNPLKDLAFIHLTSVPRWISRQ